MNMEDFLTWIEASKPRFIIARFVDNTLVEWGGADNEQEAMAKRLEFKARGGLVDVFKNNGNLPDPKLMN